MASAFTELVTGGFEDGSATSSIFEDVLESLRRLLVAELRRRGLWNAPPSYLGILGGESWSDPALLEELLLDCYEFVFVRRCAALRRQARVHADIDGWVCLNVRHFLHETQRRHDPIGYRTFEVAHGAVRRLLERSELHLLAGDPQVRNDSVLGPRRSQDPADAAPLDVGAVRAWTDELMPELLTAWHVGPVAQALAELIAAHADREPAPFRFRDLVHPLKSEVRSRWRALLFEDTVFVHRPSSDDGEAQFPIDEAPPAFDLEQELFALLDCIARGIERSEGERTRDQLRRLLSFLRHWSAALEGGSAAAPPPPDARLSRLLQIPRGRMKGLREDLAALADGCRGGRERSLEAVPGAEALAGSALPPPAEAMEATTMDSRQRRELLRRRTRESLRRQSAAGEGGGTEVGARLLFPGSEIGVEWLLVETAPAGGATLVPVDPMPLAGSRDLHLEADLGEALIARCGMPARVGADVLATAVPAGRIPPGVVDRVRARLRGLVDPAQRPSMLESEVDEDSEYRAWMELVAVARRRLEQGAAEPSAGRLDFPRGRPPARFRGALGYALAAVLAVAAIGLGLRVHHLSGRLAESNLPILLPVEQAGEIRWGAAERGSALRLVAVEGRHALVYLVFRDLEAGYPLYRVRVVDAGTGETSWESRDLEPVERLLVLPAGDRSGLRLELVGIGPDGAAEVVDVRRLAFDDPGPADDGP